MNPIPTLYKILAGVVAILIVIFGSMWIGYSKGKIVAKVTIDSYEQRVSDLQTKIDHQQVQVVDHVITKYVDRIIKVKETGEHNEQVANTIVVDNSILSNGWVYTHNASVAGTDAVSTIAADATPSGIEANQALGTIVDNYATCHKTEEQLNSLQDWVVQTKANIDAANKEAAKKKHFWNKG